MRVLLLNPVAMRLSKDRAPPSTGLCVAVALCLAFGACDRGPQTFPVRGQVVWNGGQPWNGGTVQFTSVADPQQVATGQIGADGSFALVSHFVTGVNARTKPGAVAGEHHVYLDEPAPQVDTDGVVIIKPIVVAKTYLVEPKDNNFTIEARRLGKP
jgi:hypothetical protein